MTLEILVGADPEVFVFNKNKPVSAHGMVPGTKKQPFKVNDGAIQVDGMALEFNIDPAKDAKTFVHNINSVFKTLQEKIPPNMRIHAVPAVFFDWDHIKAQPKEALELGCDPDFNAYSAKPNERPNGDTNMRTASGHIHIGWTKDQDPADPVHFESCMQLVKQLDFYLGIPSLALDGDNQRRTLYGKAGCFRPKPYGVEYRTLSNFWLAKDAYKYWVFTTTQLAVERLIAGENLVDKYNLVAQHAIDGSRSAEDKLANIISLYPDLWERINTIRHLMVKD